MSQKQPAPAAQRSATRIAVLADASTQFLAASIREQMKQAGIEGDVFDAPYDQIELLAHDSASALYAFAPQFVLLLFSPQRWFAEFYRRQPESRAVAATDFVARVTEIWRAIQSRCEAKILQCNLPAINDGIFGNFANLTTESLLYQLRFTNIALADAARNHTGVFIVDIDAAAADYGYGNALAPRFYVHGKLPFHPEFSDIVARQVTAIVAACLGRVRKCLILDLDNTLWGGTVGDDGMHGLQLGDFGIGPAFVEFQLWCRALSQRGIILAVCSKNDYETAYEAFANHPDMVLTPDDIAVFVANWDTKVDNIKRIQATLNVGFDSLVFVDDNPYERELVRRYLPEVSVPEMPEDPAEYVAFLRGLGLFETASFVAEDRLRTASYKSAVAREELRQTFASLAEYLASLDMVCVFGPFLPHAIPRIAQLSQRSNQFNLRTQRYTETEIKNFAADPDTITLAFQLSDRFGDYGLVSAVIVTRRSPNVWFIDTWIMSCRVLQRGLEDFVLNALVEAVVARGGDQIIGEYIPTAKNGLVADLYRNFGFCETDGLWRLDVAQYVPRPTAIRPQPYGDSGA